jgi:hypothetical protein
MKTYGTAFGDYFYYFNSSIYNLQFSIPSCLDDYVIKKLPQHLEKLWQLR